MSGGQVLAAVSSHAVAPSTTPMESLMLTVFVGK